MLTQRIKKRRHSTIKKNYFPAEMQVENKNQVIIDFINTETAASLKQKWDNEYSKNEAILLSSDNFDLVSLDHQDPEGTFKISIVGHCHPASDYLRCNEGKKIFSVALAEKLKNFIERNHLEGKVIINIVACYTGRGDDQNSNFNLKESFASKLHNELAKYNLDIPVVARTHVVYVRGRGKEIGTKRTASLKYSYKDHIRKKQNGEEMEKIYKQPGSKIIYKANKFGGQEKVDAYYHGWTSHVQKTITKTIHHTRNEKRKTYLKHLKKACRNKSNAIVLANLQHALNDPTPVNSIYANDCVFFRKHNINNDAYRAIAALVEEKEQLEASPHTNKKAVIVRSTMGNK